MEEGGGPVLGGKKEKSEHGLSNRNNTGGYNSAQIAEVQVSERESTACVEAERNDCVNLQSRREELLLFQPMRGCTDLKFLFEILVYGYFLENGWLAFFAVIASDAK